MVVTERSGRDSSLAIVVVSHSISKGRNARCEGGGSNSKHQIVTKIERGYYREMFRVSTG
jgi:hypothetical protein